MKIVCLIPARLNSKRFHGKLLKEIEGRTVIHRTYNGVKECGGIDQLYVVTNSVEIQNHVNDFNGNVIFEDKEFKTGTDRISSVCEGLDADYVINVQGDEPFINCNVLSKLIGEVRLGRYETYTIVNPITDVNDITDHNTVKSIVNRKDELIYLTRTPIKTTKPLKHIGVYAYSKEILKQIPTMGQSNLEECENIELNRLIDNGHKVKTIESDECLISIDTLEDLNKSITILRNEQ